jgi:hypothetical protein
MALITKKIGNREYAYLAHREGSKIVHKYLGAIDKPEVIKIISDHKEFLSVPNQFRSLFWDTSLRNMDIKRNFRYIIERVLEFGDMNALQWIQRMYTTQSIINILRTTGNLSEKSRNFWMIWFDTSDV